MFEIDHLATKLAPLLKMTASPRSAHFRLMLLDSGGRPGLSLIEFWGLFTLCHCGMVTTRAAYPQHLPHCPGKLLTEEEEIVKDLSEVENMLIDFHLGD